MKQRNPNGRVVVGVDDSLQTLEVVRYALDLAHEHHYDLTLAHTWSFPWAAGYFGADDVEAMRLDAKEVVTSVLNELNIPDGMHVDVVTAREPVIPFLRKLSESARLLVIGRHDYWSERALDGGVSSALATKAACPVVTVPSRCSVAAVGSGPVVICLDGISAATESLRFAFDLADRGGRTLLVLHAVGPHTGRKAIDADRRDIAEVTAGWQEQYPSVPVMHSLAVDDRSEAIIAASAGASMVVLGSPHRRSWSWLYSLARSILNRVHCPLVVVPQHEVAPHVPAAPDIISSIAPIPKY